MNIQRLALPLTLVLLALGIAAQKLKHPYASETPINEPKIFAEGMKKQIVGLFCLALSLAMVRQVSAQPVSTPQALTLLPKRTN